MPRHPLNALLRLIAITYREKFYVRIFNLKFNLFDQLLVSYLQIKEQIRQLLVWWRISGSNRRPPECKSGALPAELIPQVKWWAREDLNLRPHAYQARALTN